MIINNESLSRLFVAETQGDDMAAVSGTELDDFDPFIRGLDAGPPRDEFGDYHLMDEGLSLIHI